MKMITQHSIHIKKRIIGRLVVSKNGIEGSVCRNTFTETDARVACRQMGLTDGVPIDSKLVATHNGFVLMDEVDCTEKDRHLTGCKF